MIYGNDPTPFAGVVVLHPCADSAPSTPAPWGPPEGLGLERFVTKVIFVPYHMPMDRYDATTPLVMAMWLADRVDLVPPTPGGES